MTLSYRQILDEGGKKRGFGKTNSAENSLLSSAGSRRSNKNCAYLFIGTKSSRSDQLLMEAIQQVLSLSFTQLALNYIHLEENEYSLKYGGCFICNCSFLFLLEIFSSAFQICSLQLVL